jgi:hypothetical protein
MVFYATIDADSIRSYMPAVPVLLPASSWARKHLSRPNLPIQITETAADSGGYVATKVWGDYRYSPAHYVAWLSTWVPTWAATMDYCCEDEITAGQPGLVRERQRRTTVKAQYFWQWHRRVPWVWVPTIQGWQVEDYVAHARELAPLIRKMRRHYGAGSAFRVGIGTLCRRASPELIRRITLAVASQLPGVPLHLWGIKLTALQARGGLPARVVSIDSAAWNGRFGPQIEAQRQSGLSQRQYAYTVALPRYLEKVAVALRRR